ncbi:MAG: DUF4358 domain-containing protein [Erysipelotrichaceae bacterium]
MKIAKLIAAGALLLTVVGCGAKDTANVDLKELDATLVEKFESGEIGFPGTMDLDATLLSDVYGINAEEALESYVVKIPMMMVQASEIAMFEVKDGQMDAVKAGVEKRLADLDATWSQYLPDQYDLVKNAAKIEKGNYFFLVIAEEQDAIVKIIEDAFK